MSRDYATIPRNRSHREALLRLLLDHAWHDHVELKRVAGVRYGARVLELKRLGYVIETESIEPQGCRYRLTGRGRPQAKRVKVLLTEADTSALIGVALTVSPTAHRALCVALTSYRANQWKL